MWFTKILAIVVGKLAIVLSRCLGNQGTDFPGRLAKKICPVLLRELAQNIKKEIILVTGTNGKTTTTNMVAAIIKARGHSYVHNQAGANMLSGIITAFVQASNWNGKKRWDYAILEVDEANIPLLFKEIEPHLLLISNFFRDQLDRYGELDHTIELIKEAITDQETQLLLNGDDPLSAYFGQNDNLRCHYFGFAPTAYDVQEGAKSREGRFCILCGQELIYTSYHYAQLGRYHCPACFNQNPTLDFTGFDLQLTNQIRFRVNHLLINSPYQGFYNAYNILAAVSLAMMLGVEDQVIQKAIADYEPRAGRMEAFLIKGKKVIQILVKNPTGLDQALAMVAQDANTKDVFIALNDNAADGRDISWIWDAELEVLADEEARVNAVVCSGQRSGDMAVRVKYAGFDPARIIMESSLASGIELAVSMSAACSYILCTYTTLFASRKILLDLQSKYPSPSIEEERQRVEAGN